MMTVRGERVRWVSPRRAVPVEAWADPGTERIRLIDAQGGVLIDCSWPVFKQQVHQGWIELTGNVDADIPVFCWQERLRGTGEVAETDEQEDSCKT